MSDIPATFATSVKRCTLTMAGTATCRLDGAPFAFTVRLSYRPHGEALTMEAFAVAVRTAAMGPVTAEWIAESVKRMARAHLPDATRIRVTVEHAPNADGVRLVAEA